ncbi:MAG TPA: molybdopterin-dependent oxidoreductase [Beijerinckiaceae bacterium]|nr:molybdopterin-dependent oxidoreductase [Beijerinckiaceae bacterium]
MTDTTCPYCGVGCGVSITPAGMQGDSDHPANFGRLCSKGAALAPTLSLQDRLLTPMLYGSEAAWDETLDFIAAELTRIRTMHGPDAIAFYVSGQLLTEDYYVANKLMKGFIGSANIDTNSRLCMSSSVAGHVRAFGEDVVPGCYEDLEEADLVVQVGSNMAWCHPVLYQRLMAARERRGTKIVTLDPRRTATAETADLHLPLKPGSDVLLFNGLLAHLAATDAVDRAWIEAHVFGFEETLAAARLSAPSIEHVAAVCDLPPQDVHLFYDFFARTERAVTLYSQGVNQSSVGTDKVNAILNCHLATGRIGRAGMGPFSLTGQPNAMGGREVGGLANQLAAHMGFTPQDIDCVRRFWNAPHIAQRPGTKAVDMFDAVADGRIQAIWIAATNPADSMPRAGRVREALAKCPLVIVADAWPTDTTKLADIVLPAASWSEKSGTVTNSERCISRQRAFRPAPGESRPDWWMFAEIGRRMGWEHAFSYRAAAAIFREHAALSAFENDGRRRFDIGALATLDDKAYDMLAPTQWPCASAGGAKPSRLFNDGDFPTPDRRARMIPLSVDASETREERALTLNTGRVRDQWHTMTRTGRVPRLLTHVDAPRVALHPDDAMARGIADGGLARIDSEHGSMILRASVDAAMRPGDIFVPMHWTDQFSSGGPVGRLVHAATDPISGQPDLKGTKVHLSAVAETWRGLLLRRSSGDPIAGKDMVWSKVPVARGFAFDMRGWSELAGRVARETDLRDLLQVTKSADLVTYSDLKKSVLRCLAVSEGRLEACVFFAAPGASIPQAGAAADRLGETLDPVARLSLLAGANAHAAAPDKIVCSCFAVGEDAIVAAIRMKKLKSHAEIGAELSAGTNCGSCIPELKKLIAANVAELSTVP